MIRHTNLQTMVCKPYGKHNVDATLKNITEQERTLSENSGGTIYEQRNTGIKTDGIS